MAFLVSFSGKRQWRILLGTTMHLLTISQSHKFQIGAVATPSQQKHRALPLIAAAATTIQTCVLLAFVVWFVNISSVALTSSCLSSIFFVSRSLPSLFPPPPLSRCFRFIGLLVLMLRLAVVWSCVMSMLPVQRTSRVNGTKSTTMNTTLYLVPAPAEYLQKLHRLRGRLLNFNI